MAWYARNLGAHLAASAATATSLADTLADGIGQVSQAHAGTCDLTHPGTPSATVIIARATRDTLEYLVLADSVLLLQPRSAELLIVTDTRLADIAARHRPDYLELSAGTREREAARQAYLAELDAMRNRPDGYWSAAADPAAAEHAISGSVPTADLAAIALLSDGAGRIVDRYHIRTWPQVAAILADDGPAELIRQVRAAEAIDPGGMRWPRGKIRDDATAIYWEFH